jgi:hypothetical protein
VTKLWTEHQRNRGSIPDSDKRLSSSLNRPDWLGLHRFNGKCDFFGLKQPGHEAAFLVSYSAGV